MTKFPRYLAVSAIVLIAIVGIVATPVATMMLLEIPGYMTAFGSAMIVINILLAALLFSKGSIEESGDAIRLGTAYLFVAMIFVPMVASFPGGIMPGSLIGTKISSIWLWSFWHAGFGLCIMRYAWLAKRPGRTASLPAALIGTLVAVALLTIVSTSLLPYLPSTLSDGHTLFSGLSGLIPITILAILLAALALVCRLRGRNLEEISLTVAMVAALFDVWLTYQGSARFSLGWYLSKCGSLFTSLAVLVTLLHEVTLLHRRAAADNMALGQLARKLTLARDESDRANGAKSRFLSGVTHELRTPLHGMLGYAELMSLEGDLNPIQSERLEVMMASGQHLLDTINATLDMALIEAEKLELVPAEVEFSDLIQTCLNVVRPAAELKGLSLGFSPEGPIRLLADPTRLRQVLINLLGNAIKFTPTGSVVIRLRQTDAEGYIRVEVADTGPGILEKHRDKLFQTFERLNAQAVSGIEGAGLGLSITGRLVHLMGGHIGYADNPGGGSVFWLKLPAPDAAPSAKIEPAALAPLVRGPRLRVLVADDQALNRSIASGFLRLAGHEVVCVDNGAAAIEAAAATDFDVILMDVRMPGMNGLEATRRIRALPAPHGEVRVVAVTAQAFAEQIAMCQQAGMDGHVTKPFKQAVLLAALESAGTAPSHPPLTAAPPAAATNDATLELLVFDRAAFVDITEFLPAAEVDEHLELLLERCETLLHRLRRSDIRARISECVDDAHLLAGSSGTFGFLSIAAAAREFEIAPDTAGVVDHLAAAIARSLPIIRQERAATASLAT